MTSNLTLGQHHKKMNPILDPNDEALNQLSAMLLQSAANQDAINQLDGLKNSDSFQFFYNLTLIIQKSGIPTDPKEQMSAESHTILMAAIINASNILKTTSIMGIEVLSNIYVERFNEGQQNLILETYKFATSSYEDRFRDFATIILSYLFDIYLSKTTGKTPLITNAIEEIKSDSTNIFQKFGYLQAIIQSVHRHVVNYTKYRINRPMHKAIFQILLSLMEQVMSTEGVPEQLPELAMNFISTELEEASFLISNDAQNSEILLTFFRSVFELPENTLSVRFYKDLTKSLGTFMVTSNMAEPELIEELFGLTKPEVEDYSLPNDNVIAKVILWNKLVHYLKPAVYEPIVEQLSTLLIQHIAAGYYSDVESSQNDMLQIKSLYALGELAVHFPEFIWEQSSAVLNEIRESSPDKYINAMAVVQIMFSINNVEGILEAKMPILQWVSEIFNVPDLDKNTKVACLNVFDTFVDKSEYLDQKEILDYVFSFATQALVNHTDVFLNTTSLLSLLFGQFEPGYKESYLLDNFQTIMEFLVQLTQSEAIKASTDMWRESYYLIQKFLSHLPDSATEAYRLIYDQFYPNWEAMYGTYLQVYSQTHPVFTEFEGITIVLSTAISRMARHVDPSGFQPMLQNCLTALQNGIEEFLIQPIIHIVYAFGSSSVAFAEPVFQLFMACLQTQTPEIIRQGALAISDIFDYIDPNEYLTEIAPEVYARLYEILSNEHISSGNIKYAILRGIANVIRHLPMEVFYQIRVDAMVAFKSNMTTLKNLMYTDGIESVLECAAVIFIAYNNVIEKCIDEEGPLIMNKETRAETFIMQNVTDIFMSIKNVEETTKDCMGYKPSRSTRIMLHTFCNLVRTLSLQIGTPINQQLNSRWVINLISAAEVQQSENQLSLSAKEIHARIKMI